MSRDFYALAVNGQNGFGLCDSNLIGNNNNFKTEAEARAEQKRQEAFGGDDYFIIVHIKILKR